MQLPGTYIRCMSGHYYAATRGDEECPTCQQVRKLQEAVTIGLRTIKRNSTQEQKDWSIAKMKELSGQ